MKKFSLSFKNLNTYVNEQSGVLPDPTFEYNNLTVKFENIIGDVEDNQILVDYIDSHGGGGSVSSVNEILPDGNGNITINISDISELVSQLNSKINNTQIGIAGGVAELDENSKVLLSQIPDISGNGKIAISANDTVQDYLINKIVAGSNITITKVNDGSNEYLLISSTGSGGGGTLVWGTITGTLSAQTDLQDALNALIPLSQKAVANGVATLGIDGTVPLNQIPSSIIGGLILKGAWSASTNTPQLQSGIGTTGWLYVVTVGNNNISLDDITTVKSGDSVFFDGSVWQKITGQTVTVASVFGRIGNIVAQTGDYNADQITETGTRKFVTATEKAAISTIGNKVDVIAGKSLSTNDFTNAYKDAAVTESMLIACSDEYTNLTTGTAKVTFRMPFAAKLLEVYAEVNTAPTGSSITTNINKNGTSIFSTILYIDANAKTSETSSNQYVLSSNPTTFADGDTITIDINQVGLTVPGKGLKVYFKFLKL